MGLYLNEMEVMIMAEGRNVLFGILAILLGLIVMAFPLISVFLVSDIVAIGIIFIGVWLLAQSIEAWSSSKGLSILSLILGFIGIIVGIGLFGKIVAFSIFAGLIIYLGGFFLIISGILTLFSGKGNAGRWGGLLGIILGILYLIVGLYALNPFYLAILIGIWLVLTGIFMLFASADAAVEK
jgi:membrane protein HdeD